MLQAKPLRLPSVAALDVNLPNYAAAIVSTDEIVALISSLEGFGARQTWIEIRKAFAVESKECADGRSACYRNRGADCGLCGGTSRWPNGPTANAPKSWAEKAYPNLIHYSSHPKGTHFATALFVSDARATFRSLRAA